MFRRAAATAALTAAGLVAVAPFAQATEEPDDGGGNGNVQLLNGLNVLPVQACGLQVPILGSILDGTDTACAVGNEGASN